MIILDVGINVLLDDFIPEGTILEKLSGEEDSALGYEASMHYMCDKWHLEWKIRHTDYVLTTELRELRSAIASHERFMQKR